MPTVDLICPGTPGDGAQIAGPGQATLGVNHIRNGGQCQIKIAAKNSSGVVIAAETIPAGGYLEDFTPPAGAVSIVAACWTDCHGSGHISFDYKTTGVA